tara:strand:- start:10 stop:456 length:447 start_codon:yes stop_codon:yes gene_type:complete
MRYYYLLLSIILISCDNTIYENYYSFHNNGWHTDSAITLSYIILDTNKTYSLSLKIRHTVDYEFRNLFVFLEDRNKDTVEIILANKNGKWLGEGISDIREFEYVFDNQRSFIRQGGYSVKLEQAMRYGEEAKREVLEHVLDIGLIVSE